MLITHKIFLYWLLYVTVIGFCIAISIMTGLPQLVFKHDHSYLSMLLIIMYILAEILSGRQAIWVSNLHKTVTDTKNWLKNNVIVNIKETDEKSVILTSNNSDFQIKSGVFADLLISLKDYSNNCNNQKIDQNILIETFSENLNRKIYIGEFIAGRIVWVGILATIIGVIMAFWPFQQQGITIDMMRSHLGDFFSGVAVAFIPTAVSFVFKIVLDFNTKIIENGASEVIEIVTVTNSSYIIPYLENGSKNAS